MSFEKLYLRAKELELVWDPTDFVRKVFEFSQRTEGYPVSSVSDEMFIPKATKWLTLNEEAAQSALKVAATKIEEEHGTLLPTVIFQRIQTHADSGAWIRAGFSSMTRNVYTDGRCYAGCSFRDAAREVGVSSLTISNWYHGYNRPQLQNLTKMYRFFREHGAPPVWSFTTPTTN